MIIKKKGKNKVNSFQELKSHTDDSFEILKSVAYEQGYLKGAYDEIKELFRLANSGISSSNIDEYLNLRMDIWQSRYKIASDDLQSELNKIKRERSR